MPSKPTSLPRWAFSASVVEPSLGKKGTGWLSNERVPAGILNWLQRNIGEWIMWLLVGSSRALPWHLGTVMAGNTTVTHPRAIAVLDSVTLLGAMALVTDNSTTTVRYCNLITTAFNNTTLAGGAAASLFAQGWLAANSERFVLVGAGGRIQTYEGGVWTARTAAAGFSDQFHHVLWTGTQFVAIGGDFEVQTSPDGITWTRRASTAPTGGPNTVSYLRTLAHGGGRLVRGGGNAAGKAEVWYSDDGGTTWLWTFTAANNTYIQKLIGTVTLEGTPIFAADGTLNGMGSNGGLVWVEGLAYTNPLSCAFEDLLIASGGTEVSPDGVTWYRVPFSSSAGVLIAAVTRQGWALFFRLASGGATCEFVRTPVQRWF